MVRYESIFITDAAASEDEIAALLKGFEESVASSSGKVLRVERWGKRRLAHRIGRHEDGNYILLYLEGAPAAARELERRYRMNDRVIKYLTVRMDKNAPEPQPVEPAAPGEEKPAEAPEAE